MSDIYKTWESAIKKPTAYKLFCIKKFDTKLWNHTKDILKDSHSSLIAEVDLLST